MPTREVIQKVKFTIEKDELERMIKNYLIGKAGLVVNENTIISYYSPTGTQWSGMGKVIVMGDYTHNKDDNTD
jgi:hypothetical protein